MSDTQNNSGKIRRKKEMTIVIIAALVVVIIASVFVIDYFQRSRSEERLFQTINESLSERLDEVKEESAKIRETMSHNIPGNYILQGETNLSDPSRAYSVMQLLPDGTVSANAFDGTIADGWWKSMTSENDKSKGLELVAILFPQDTEPALYAVWNDMILEWNSVYYGEVENSSRFNSSFVSASETGKMTIDINSSGKASGEFVDTNENSENKGLKYAFSGEYTVDGEIIEITLNNATTKFLMFDYGIEDSETDSGIAPIFYKKQA